VKPLSQRLEERRPILLDGATGTELQRRGVPMDGVAWCGLAVASHPEIVRQVHLDYIQAGAEVIITNTFASGRHLLRAAGAEALTESVNRQAVLEARQARDEAAAAKAGAVESGWELAPEDVWIAGSISPMAAAADGSSRPSLRDMAAIFTEQAELLADSGVDLLLLEMMRDIDFSCAALEAASATGLPVWVGFSCKRTQQGRLVMHPAIGDEIGFEACVAAVMAQGGSLAAVMHSDVNVIGDALSVIQTVWDGPAGAYPESGYFEMPNWQFVDIIQPQAFADEAQKWVEQGAKLVGGCCGIGVAHIRTMARRLRETHRKAPPSNGRAAGSFAAPK